MAHKQPWVGIFVNQPDEHIWTLILINTRQNIWGIIVNRIQIRSCKCAMLQVLWLCTSQPGSKLRQILGQQQRIWSFFIYPHAYTQWKPWCIMKYTVFIQKDVWFPGKNKQTRKVSWLLITLMQSLNCYAMYQLLHIKICKDMVYLKYTMQSPHSAKYLTWGVQLTSTVLLSHGFN